MQNTIYPWFLCLMLSFLPIGSNANIAVPKAQTNRLVIASAAHSATTPRAASNASISAKDRRHFPSENSLERFGIVEKNENLLGKSKKMRKKRFFTEGVSDADNEKKTARRRRIFSIILAVITGLLLIYFLQGTIWLSVLTLGIVSYFVNRNKINDWERRRYERMQNPDVTADTIEEIAEDGSVYKKKIPLSHPLNKWTRRAVNRFAIGLIAPSIGGILLLLGLFGGGSLAVVGGLLVAIGVGFLIVSIVNAFQAVQAKEPRRKYAVVVLVVGLLFLLQYLLGFAASGI